MRPLPPIIAATFIFIAFFFSFGCSNQYVDEIDRGANYNYQPGHPELRLAATGQINPDNTPIIIVSGDIVHGSLVYTDTEEGFASNISIEILIRNVDKEDQPITKRTLQDTIRSAKSSISNSQAVYRFQEVFEVDPGAYEVQAIITDRKSGKRTVQTVKTEIPDPEEPVTHITEIRVLGKQTSSKEDFSQVTTYDIPSKIDSLKFIFQVTNNKPDRPIELNSKLVKFRSDTSIARPMHFNNYSSSSIQHIGIDYDKFDVIQQSKRTLEQSGSVLIEFMFSDLPRGNYRLEVSSNLGEDNEIYKARDFSIKSPNYPSLKTPRELARPLSYLMYEEDYKELMAIEDPRELKNAIDRFWLSNIQNSNMAKNVISQYYQRVEEANKQFSNFKEGWKTDPGMIYILFGPPMYSDQFSDQMFWSYSYNQDDPERNFLFELSRIRSNYYPFYNYILQRSAYYHTVHYRQVQRWLSGSILRTNL